MMKGKNPNRTQKKLLEANGYDCTEWLVVKIFSNSILFRNKSSDETVTLCW